MLRDVLNAETEAGGKKGYRLGRKHTVPMGLTFSYVPVTQDADSDLRFRQRALQMYLLFI